jgi:hypothetical protein
MMIELMNYFLALSLFSCYNRQSKTNNEGSNYTGVDDLRSPDGIPFECSLIWTSNESHTNMKRIN